jgi:hypothetical protein
MTPIFKEKKKKQLGAGGSHLPLATQETEIRRSRFKASPGK